MRTMTTDRRRSGGRLALWLLALVLLLVFLWMAIAVHGHHALGFDATLLTWMHHHTTPSRTSVAALLSRVGGPKILGSASLLMLILLAALRRYRLAFLFAVEVGGAAVLDLAIKAYVARPRPTLYPHLVHETGFSFPSGHAMGGLAFFLALFLLLWRTLPGGWRWLGVLGLILAAVIGVTRPYLQVHYPSDIVAGWAAGAAWVLAAHLTLTAGEARRRGSPL